jgi:hypothetical protein
MFSPPRAVRCGAIIGPISDCFMLTSPNGSHKFFSIPENSGTCGIWKAEDIILKIQIEIGWKEFKNLGLHRNWILTGPIHSWICREIFINPNDPDLMFYGGF